MTASSNTTTRGFFAGLCMMAPVACSSRVRVSAASAATAGSFRRRASSRCPLPRPERRPAWRPILPLPISPSGAAREKRLEVRACALRFRARHLGGIAEAEIAVDQAGAFMVLYRHTGGFQRVRIGCALVAQGIEPGGGDDRGRDAGKLIRAQRRDAPVGGVRGICEIMTAKPLHHGS